mmetsp:Transcript_97940/g.280158  ORF Transcript_97940/g.280158 Transcript_97940/m.280158 type:complete len:593 (+) Transcript_97940:3634-5412(+)
MYEYDHGDTSKARPGRPKAKKLIYLGIPPDSSRGYLGFNPENRTIKVCYDVTFDESMAQRANNLRTYDQAREGWQAQEELAFTDQKSKIDSDQVRRVYATDKERDDDKEEEIKDEDGNSLTTLSHFPTNIPSDGTTKKTKSMKRLKRNRKAIRHWVSSLPSIELQPNDDLIGRYVHMPFEDGYYFGIVTSKSEDPPPDGAAEDYEGYNVTFEDEDEVEFDATVINSNVVDDDHTRRTGTPTQEELDSVHLRNEPQPKPTKSIKPRNGSSKKNKRVSERRRNPKRSTSTPEVYGLAFRAQPGQHHPSHIDGPMTDAALEEYYRRELLERTDGHIRPHRLEAIGHPVPRSKADKAFMKTAQDYDIPIQYILPNPKKKGSESYDRYNLYCLCTTMNQVVAISTAQRPKGQSAATARNKAIEDMIWDYEHAYMMFPQNESMIEGHIFNAKQLAQDNRYNCRADSLMKFAKAPHHALRVVLGTAHGMTLHNQLMEEKARCDALKYGENPTALNALMENELKKLPILDADGVEHFTPSDSKEARTGIDKDRWSASERVEMEALEKFGTFELEWTTQVGLEGQPRSSHEWQIRISHQNG